MAPTKQQGPKEKFLKKVQSFSDTLYIYMPGNVQQIHVQQPSTYEKPKDASAVLGS
jgi:hypothetical protein